MTGAFAQVEDWPIENVFPRADNPRLHSEEQLAQITSSMREWGWTVPMLVDEAGVLIAGHGRLDAARRLELERVPVIVARGWSEAKKRAYVIADNKLTLNGRWNDALLVEQLQALTSEGFDAALTGFADHELADLLGGAASSSRPGADTPGALPPVATSRPGDLWKLGEHRLLCGDARTWTAFDRLLEGKAADCLWTDPPYSVGCAGGMKPREAIANDGAGDESAFDQFLLETVSNAAAAIRPGASFYLAHADIKGAAFLSAIARSGLKLYSYLVWRKNSFVMSRSDYHWQHELLLYGWREGRAHRFFGGRKQSSVVELPGAVATKTAPGVWQIRAGDETFIVRGESLTVEGIEGSVMAVDRPLSSDDHPTMKPVALIERCLKNSTRRGELVLDPFAGSGSTLIAAHQLGRRAALIEIEPRYVDSIIARWQTLAGAEALLAGDDELTFSEVASLGSARPQAETVVSTSP